MSMRIVPPSAHTSTFKSTNTSAPSAPGVHDTLRHGIGPNTLSAESPAPVSRHPLEARLKAWESTQEALRMESLRRTFGMAEPIRRGMELKITRNGEWRPLALGGGAGIKSVHEDILRGREATLDWEDVFTGEEQRSAVTMHEEMERKLKI
ncbi:proteasome maturation factor UMP1 [Daldinia decipiens]|uniref:proteasome maturation factor UMP1 n=1 Tax=Daldinia decipiens TaxID=326647 RepID=UPI0020C1FC72|nr:proteasome maturation factor UMP1 [Daldinia decipiens]XP_049156095.1 proteasome maturation factor UMP1 [Daldinia loculata]KAI1644361.1 proteasome maturation factor UMP1 [Daldinia loculata]KAI1652720.1 proteasome maturation factor UMP1 [Daldinia decipiens]